MTFSLTLPREKQPSPAAYIGDPRDLADVSREACTRLRGTLVLLPAAIESSGIEFNRSRKDDK